MVDCRRCRSSAAALLLMLGGGARVRADPAPTPTTLAFSGYVQADTVPWNQRSIDEIDPGTGEPLNQTRVLVRRARLRADVERGPVRAALELDGNTIDGEQARLLAAYVGYAHTIGVAPERRVELVGTAGLFKIPFGREVPESERDRLFLESSSASRALFPGNYDAGVKVEGRWRFLRLVVAAMNGAPVADAQFSGRDPSQSVDLLGRGGLDVAAGEHVRVAAGVSLLVGKGFHPGSPPTKDELIWVDANEDGLVQTSELQVISGVPATPSETFDHEAIGADVALSWRVPGLGAGAAFVELTLASNLDRALQPADPLAYDRNLRELGWQLGAWQELGAHAALALRYDRYNPDRDAREIEGADIVPIDPSFATFSVVAAGRVDAGRLSVSYDHERNPLGRDLSGRPTTLASDRVTIRAQVQF